MGRHRRRSGQQRQGGSARLPQAALAGRPADRRDHPRAVERHLDRSLGRWKAYLKKNPFDIKPAFIAAKTTSTLLPETVLGRPSKAPGETPVAV
ncbi:MAG: hypothetical protein DME05_02110 [Candidatus Rokuibacteriota bacterium]|nr:MAG: hypothetical protein DME05_02110 [Candidatus Rokubacteria bacterium]